MGNAYKDHKDVVASDLVDSAIDRLKNPSQAPDHVPAIGTDHTNTRGPAERVLPPSKIGKTDSWPRKIRIDLPS